MSPRTCPASTSPAVALSVCRPGSLSRGARVERTSLREMIRQLA